MTAKENHVFIVGLPRSGTSIVYRTIQQLQGFRSGLREDPHLIMEETFIFKDKVSFEDEDLHYKSLINYIYQDKAAYESFLRSVAKHTRKLREDAAKPEKKKKFELRYRPVDELSKKIRRYLSLKKKQLMWMNHPKKKIIRQYFKTAQNVRQCKRLVEKTPHHYLNLHQIFWTFPKARVIWMVRHPLDIITSSIRRAKVDSNYGHYWNADTFIAEFAGSFIIFDFYKKLFGDRLHMVKYEDFVSDSEGVLKQICEAIDEPFSKDALTLKKNKKINFKPDPFISENISSNTGRKWTDHISIEDAEKIERALLFLLKKHDFKIYSEALATDKKIPN